MDFGVNDVKILKVDGLPTLNPQQTEFLTDTLSGVSFDEAWEHHFNKGRQKNPHSIASLKQTIKKSVWFTKYMDYYMKQMEQRKLNEIGWNLETSMLEHRRIYSLNLVEVERLSKAHDKAIEYYTRKKEQAIDRDDEKKIDYYEEKIIKEIKSKNMALASNQACLESLDALDKIAGLQNSVVNNTANINFFGDGMWDD